MSNGYRKWRELFPPLPTIDDRHSNGRFHGTYPPNFNEGTHLISRKGPTPFQVRPFDSELSDERCYLGQLEEDPVDGQREDQRSYASANQNSVRTRALNSQHRPDSEAFAPNVRKFLESILQPAAESSSWMETVDWEYVRQEVYGKGTTVKHWLHSVPLGILAVPVSSTLYPHALSLSPRDNQFRLGNFEAENQGVPDGWKSEVPTISSLIQLRFIEGPLRRSIISIRARVFSPSPLRADQAVFRQELEARRSREDQIGLVPHV